MTPGRGAHVGLLIDGDIGAAGQSGDQRIADACGGADIDVVGAHDGTGSAGTQVDAAGGLIVVIGVGQVDPALGAVAPGIAHGHHDGAGLAALGDTDLGGGDIGVLADVHIVIGDGDGDAGNNGGKHGAHGGELNPAAGGQLQPLGGAVDLLGHNGDNAVTADHVDLLQDGGILVDDQLVGIRDLCCLIDDVGGQGIQSGNLIAAGLPAGGEGLAGGGGANTGDQSGAVVPAQELLAGAGGIDNVDGSDLVAVKSLDLLLGGAEGSLACIEDGEAEGAGVGTAVNTVQIQVGHGHAGDDPAAVGGVIGEAGVPVVAGAHGIHKCGAGIAIIDGLHKFGIAGPAGALHIGEPDQSVVLLLNQRCRDSGVDRLVQLGQLLTQILIRVGLGDGCALHTGCAVADFVNAIGHLIGGFLKAHVILDYLDAGFADGEAVCRCRDGRSRDQTDKHHKSQQQAGNSLFHRCTYSFTQL